MANSSSSTGISFMGVLQIVFIVLKLCKVITWSWWLVLTPLWFEIGLVIILFIIYVLMDN